MRRVSGASSHRFGLDAEELLELERCGWAVRPGFSNVHCWSWEETARSTILELGKKEKIWGKEVARQDAEGGGGDIL